MVEENENIKLNENKDGNLEVPCPCGHVNILPKGTGGMMKITCEKCKRQGIIFATESFPVPEPTH